ncbi:RamA family antibiotic efflux transcriptional regulator [Cedecea davisae]|uniref:RamA family antibiotic efflux transcriptional regulator n=1 Tax=Cedecea davisae TaxID=158484 RepID=A0ABS6DLN4_9ENTR|nr:RamA family antibiotic efflux transcriptional regulator [Cedecea davisae]MBU4684097.1 RamA family antibiotic efflux transcriptional regulator [Cedecea davisae]MBU4689057.1 RamA family antibiotic efflux transcriptional regulator [Cedecea davisae]
MNFSTLVVESIADWIDHNIHQPLRIEDVARYAGYSKWHFQRLFLDCKGTSLGRYIRERKLSLAAEDLRNTQERIVDISMKYGFESQQTFNRLFTRNFRLSPGNYRKQQAKTHRQRSA